jgi:TrmH family RNA methyltransferase
MLKISSVQNSLIKQIILWQNKKKQRQKDGVIILESPNLCTEFQLNFPEKTFEQLIVSEDFFAQNKFLPFEKQENIIIVPKELLQKISTTKTDLGILGVVKKPINQRKFSQYEKIIILEGVQDPANLGNILRSAAAFGFDAIIANKNCADLWSAKVLRNSAGAHFYFDLHTDYDLKEIKKEFPGKLLATICKGGKPFDKFNCPEKFAWCFGSEGTGLSEDFLQICDEKITIPLSNNFDSLNVGVAAGIFCAKQ